MVFEAMKKLLGERGPQNIDEVNFRLKTVTNNRGPFTFLLRACAV